MYQKKKNWSISLKIGSLSPKLGPINGKKGSNPLIKNLQLPKSSSWNDFESITAKIPKIWVKIANYLSNFGENWFTLAKLDPV